MFHLTIYGAPVESILGSSVFVLIYLGLCYFISKVYCQTPRSRPTVGASGVIAGLGSISLILTLFCLIFMIAIRLNLCSLDRKIPVHSKKSGTMEKREFLSEFESSSKYWLANIAGLGFICSLILVTVECIHDIYYPNPEVANEIHLIG